MSIAFPLEESIKPDMIVTESAAYKGRERRSKPRISRRFPAVVKGINTRGYEFESDTVLDNLSADGLYFRLAQQVAAGAEVWVTFKLAVGPTAGLKVRSVAVRGVVRRVELQPDGKAGLAVSITDHKFL